MFKVSNGQLSAFNSPVIASLFADPARQFPVQDAFRLSDLVQQIQTRLQTYNEHVRKTIKQGGGEIAKSGQVSYKNPEDQLKTQLEIDKLNEVEIELIGALVLITENWPKLSLAEATILRPITDGNTSE